MPDKVTITKSKLDDLADAVASKTGATLPLTIAQMETAIENMSPPTPTLQDKSVSITPSETAQSQTVSADSGYDGLDEVSVSVGAIASDYVGSGITRQSSSDLTASGATVTAPAGYYASAASKSVASGTAGTPTATKGSVSNHSVSVTPSVTNTTGYITGSTKTGTAVTVSASELVSGTYTIDSSGTKDVTNYASASVASGTAGTPSATKGTVSNHSVTVTPNVTNTTGWISGSTKTGTAVTVSASELVSGSETKTANGTYDVTNLAELVVSVASTSKNFQVSNTQVRLANKTTLSDTGLTLTVAETGTYNVYWSAFRTNTSSGYTWGSQLYIGSTGYGSENTSWSNSYNQINKLTGVSLTKNQVLHVYGRTRSGNSYYICCSNLIIEQTA